MRLNARPASTPAGSAAARGRTGPRRTAAHLSLPGISSVCRHGRVLTIVRTMKTLARTPFVTHTLAAIAVVGALAGCATPADNKEQCLAADWRTVGYEDGLRGAPADRIGGHRVACGKHGVTPDLAAYLDGRERGLQQYCQPRNGFRAGVNGNAYANVCAGAAEAAFIDAYRQGRQIYDARAALRSCDERGHRRTGVAQGADRAPHRAGDRPGAADAAAHQPVGAHRAVVGAHAGTGRQRADPRAPEPLRALTLKVR